MESQKSKTRNQKRKLNIKSVSLVGYGRVGSHLDFALRKTKRYRIVGKDADIIFITTQDSRIASAAKNLVRKELRGKTVFHTSGVLTSDALRVLKQKGAETGTFHPVQTFEVRAKKRKDAVRFKGIYVAVEGSKGAVATGSRIARDLGAKPVIIEKRDKILHHICGVIASNYLVAIISKIEELGKKIRINGFNKRSFFSIYEPLVRQTLENIKSKGAIRSLTGPIERGDLDTLKLHLKEIELKVPNSVSFYKSLGRETVFAAFKKGSINRRMLKSLLMIFD